MNHVRVGNPLASLGDFCEREAWRFLGEPILWNSCSGESQACSGLMTASPSSKAMSQSL